MKNSKELLEETEKLNKENKSLQQQLQEAKETIDAIKNGNIDALVIPDKKELKVYTETTTDKTYRILIEKMNEGAVTIDKYGTILYCNSSFANKLNLPLQKVTGTKFENFIDDSSKESFKALLKQGWENYIKDEVYIISNDGKVIPVLLSMKTMQLDNKDVLSIIITDISVRHKIQEELEKRKRQLEQKNLELESANKKLAFQNDEKEKRAAEKEKRAEELSVANKELAFQNDEKEKRAAELIIANKELAFQNNEKEKRAAELDIANKELAFQNNEKEKRTAELSLANKELAFQNNEKEKRAAELVIANKELAFQNEVKEKRAAESVIANKELAYQNELKEKRAAELVIANEELAFQNEEKEKRAAELSVANIELAFQNNEKEKRAAELVIANKKLAYQNEVKEKRAAELIIANKELVFQNEEKGKRAAELVIANEELAFQNNEKEKRAAELNIANIELAFQSNEKEKRAAELSIANKELTFQNEEKEKRAAELSIANKELAFQNEEKEKRATELSLANKELAFQNNEKEKRAAELVLANKELAFQNNEKEKRAAELSVANKDLTTFTFVSSHDLQEPLRKIKNFVSVLLEEETKNLSDDGKNYLKRMYEIAKGMQTLIEDLLTYAGTKVAERKFEKTDLTMIVEEVKKDFEEIILKKKATIELARLCETNIIRFQFRQLMHNLISNSLKFSKPDVAPHIIIKSEIVNANKLNNAHLNDTHPDSSSGLEVGQEKLSSKINYCHIAYSDNGIGFDPQYNHRIFEVFQRLHSKEEYEGTGIGLAICKRIVENHNGFITATGELNKGARFDIYIPTI